MIIKIQVNYKAHIGLLVQQKTLPNVYIAEEAKNYDDEVKAHKHFRVPAPLQM